MTLSSITPKHHQAPAPAAAAICRLPREFLTGGILFCYGLSLYLYLRSFRPGKHLLAKGGNTGNHLYDFFIGRELNPRHDPPPFCAPHTLTRRNAARASRAASRPQARLL